MQTQLADFIRDTEAGQEADAILRKCTHCGFCLANCPTYRLWGDELDSPRGRIYQVKQVLEGAEPTESLQTHLDRCLTCRACETTCPSGVEYGRLADLGREIVEREVPRPVSTRALRWALRVVLPRRQLFSALLGIGRTVRPLVPQPLRSKIRPRRTAPAWPQAARERTVLMLEGCVQPALDPVINPQTARVADGLGFQVIRTPEAGCCGAVNQHLGDVDTAKDQARRNIDAWWPHVEAGAGAIIVNASGCGAQVKDYGHLLAGDPDYAERAERVSTLAVDPVEFLEHWQAELRPAADAPRRIAFQSPCTLQHAQGLGGRVEALLGAVGFELTPVADPHICCGSAGTYSVLQPETAKTLRQQKLDNLNAGAPELIATANIGCLTHLDEASDIPVRHWLELVTVEGQPATEA
ncbi:Anaerobic glycerol-3-phosphate dehydrogenase subunit C [wastewater metagenome]|uniref:Anaerobic glycerol-3-phosphate dehydrogenase subunit C n=4 Tax=root TaxID=1 RepID=A0A5B8RFD7_9ZZZZ|nr:glycolate oxidase subunit GlcF [Arhodomonas aquaeolei]MCS4504377.1 glycolate oxidase subunit GlcF [Arhodomonas aquaeolei]QEA07570.1 anaerobic glycerol-3-phosphate dehydrogenase subunit C [uncultured organism]